MPDNYKLKDKIVIVTGASSGIGWGCAEAFAKEGSTVVCTGRNESALKEIVQKCKDHGLSNDQVIYIVADHAKEEDNTRVIDTTVAKFGRLDVLVNNAGFGIPGFIKDVSMSDYDRQMNVNVRAVFQLTKLAIPHLRKTKGNIVNVSSVAGMRSFPDISIYCLSKAAVDQLTRTSCLEVASDGVRVNAVNPGIIVTNIHRRAGFDEKTCKEILEHTKVTHPLGRHGVVKEVADVVLFLASDAASFVTGATVPVDGGWQTNCPR